MDIVSCHPTETGSPLVLDYRVLPLDVLDDILLYILIFPFAMLSLDIILFATTLPDDGVLGIWNEKSPPGVLLGGLALSVLSFTKFYLHMGY